MLLANEILVLWMLWSAPYHCGLVRDLAGAASKLRGTRRILVLDKAGTMEENASALMHWEPHQYIAK